MELARKDTEISSNEELVMSHRYGIILKRDSQEVTQLDEEVEDWSKRPT